KLALQRRRHGGCHRLRIRPGQLGGHLNGREVDVGQVADGQRTISGNAEEQDADHDERRHHRPGDEDLVDVHDFTLTFAPGASRSWPSVTTVSPGATLPCTTTRLSTARPTVTGRNSTVESDFTT